MTSPSGPDLRDLLEADVYVGALHAAGGSVRARSVSWSLLRTGKYPGVTAGGAVPAFFAGPLPEGVRLGVVTSSTKTSADDHPSGRGPPTG